jgi:hypothetical protein
MMTSSKGMYYFQLQGTNLSQMRNNVVILRERRPQTGTVDGPTVDNGTKK